jgi:hypothetical protein
MKIRRFEKFFNEESEKKKDSGFGWGKTLGTTAAIAGTMYGAKKGVFGNTIRRGYNTAYGRVGNAIGSNSMVNSAARDWAKGSVKGPGIFGNRMQYKRDLVNKQNEFKSQFNKNLTSSNTSSNVNNSTTTKQQKPKEKPSVVNEKINTEGNTTNNATPQVESVMSKSNKPLIGPTTNFKYNTGARGDIDWAFHKGNVSYARKPATPQVESVMKPVDQSNLTAQQRREQRLATTGAGNYQAAKDLGFKTEKTVRHKITPQEKARRTQEYNQRVQANKNKKNAGLMGISSPDSNTFYATPNMFEQRIMSDSRYRRKYFSIMLNLFQ